MTFDLRVNGARHVICTEEDAPLLHVLRHALKLKGAKLGCGLGQCGACAVLADGEVVLSCAQPAKSFVGREITTVEGLAATEIGARVQAAFIEASAAQCGYCTAGLVVAATGLLGHTPRPTREVARAALAPHLCRCGAHPRVLRAIEIASRAT